MLGLTERAGSRYDSLNFLFTVTPLERDKKVPECRRSLTGVTNIRQAGSTFVSFVLTCRL